MDILAVNVHVDGDVSVDQFDDFEDEPSSTHKGDPSAVSIPQLSERLQKQVISSKAESSQGDLKQQKCSTCNALVGDAKAYREHFKSEWHKHNLRRKTRQLPPLTAEECMADLEVGDSRADLKDYSF